MGSQVSNIERGKKKLEIGHLSTELTYHMVSEWSSLTSSYAVAIADLSKVAIFDQSVQHNAELECRSTLWLFNLRVNWKRFNQS